MKHAWLFFGILCLFAGWIQNTLLFLCFMVVMARYYHKHYVWNWKGILFFIAISILWLLPSNSVKPISKVLHIKEIRTNYMIANNGEQNVLVFGVNQASFDDIIEVQGNYEYVDSVHNIRSFNFAEWLHRREIYYQINATSFKVMKEGQSLRHRLYQHVKNIHNEKQRSWIMAMIFGIHQEDVSFFVTSSGMHISYIFMLLGRCLLVICSTSVTQFLLLLGLGAFGYVSVFSASLLRILCFRLVRFVFSNYTNDDVLGISMVLTLLLFPYMRYELAFMIPVGFRLVALFNVQRRKALFTSFAVLIPIQFLYFHVCNPIQILLFRYVRFVYALLYVGCWILLFFSNAFLYQVIMGIADGVQHIEKLGFSLFYTPISIWLFLWVYYLMKYISVRDHSFYALCVMVLYIPIAPYLDPFGEVEMIDVGQGDCTLIRLPFHQGVMLIDVMGSLYKNISEDIIVPVLKGKGIHRIDKVIITHQDYDHSGGLKELKKLIPVKEVITTKGERTTLGPLQIPFVLPTFVGKDENDNSIMTYVEVYGLRFLFMGDAGSEAEEAVMNAYPKLQIDILKVGHHGSRTSSSLSFLHALQPQVALISAGRGNRYGHPHEETMNRLKQEQIYPLITSKSGGISIKFCKYFAFFRTADNEFGIIHTR